MRILFVTGEFPPQAGGVGDYTDRLAAALTSVGHEVGVVTGTPVHGEAAVNSDAEWANGPNAAIWRSVGRWDLRAWRIMAARIRAWRPDIVHLQYQAAAYGLRGAVTLYPWLLRGWNIRPLSVVTFHDVLTPHLFPLAGRLGLDRRAVAWLGWGADAAIATNADDARQLVGMRARRVWEVPIGANIPVASAPVDREALRAQLGVAPEAPLLAYFGFYTATKGVEDLLSAFALLVRERPDARLHFIGGGTVRNEPANEAYVQRLRRLAEELALTDRLIWTGYAAVASVSTHLQAADVVVLPFRDGLSLRRGTVMAALSHGCALVSTAPNRPIPELEQAVLLSRAHDPADLHRAIKASLEPATLVRLRRAAQTAAAQFSWDTIAASHTALYRALCHSDAG